MNVQVNVLLNNCKQNMTSLSLLSGRTVSIQDSGLFLVVLFSVFFRAAIRQREIDQGYDKPAVVRYYGDTRKETVLKFRKSPLISTPSNVHKGGMPRIPTISDERNEGKKLMQASHIDGSTVI